MRCGISVAFVQQNDSEIAQILGFPPLLEMRRFFYFFQFFHFLLTHTFFFLFLLDFILSGWTNFMLFLDTSTVNDLILHPLLLRITDTSFSF